MIDVEFDCNQKIILIQAKLDDIFQNIINKYIQKSLLEPDKAFFIVNGKPINPQGTIESHMNALNKENKKLKVLVQISEDRITQINQFIVSKDIICPICYEPCLFKIENYKINLFGCIHKHSTKIKINDFINKQKINISSIICDKCKTKNKGNSANNEFYKCLTCNQNLCLLCKSYHMLNHAIINYDLKNYICQKHNEHLIKYCYDCNMNICFTCEDEHPNHQVIFLGDIKPNIEQIKNTLLKNKEKIELFNDNIKEIIRQLNIMIDTMNLFYEINNNILKNYDKQNRNFQNLSNIKELSNNIDIIKEIEKINTIVDIKDKFANIIDFYNNINNFNNNEIKIVEKEPLKEIIKENNSTEKKNNYSSDKEYKITIVYKINKNMNKVKLFHDTFVKNNKKNCCLIIDEKEKELCEYLSLNKNQKNKDNLEINLVLKNPISNASYLFKDCQSLISISDISFLNNINLTEIISMFENCTSLISLPDMSKLDIKKVTNMSYIFNKCSSLISLPDISLWDTQNIENMISVFEGCQSLQSIPDISNWDTKNVKYMQYMFSDCSSLISLPDISKWDTKNVTNMCNMFSKCNSLISLPDISNWNLKNVDFIDSMFSNCKALKYLPDISLWDIKIIKNISYLFSDCNSLLSLPDISKWNTRNITDMTGLFYNCNSLKTIPDISMWDTTNVTNMNFVFQNCSSISTLPDISKWNTINIKSMSSMFENCKSLESLPDLSKWEIKNVDDMKKMFKGCRALISLPDISKWIMNKKIDKSNMFDDLPWKNFSTKLQGLISKLNA